MKELVLMMIITLTYVVGYDSCLNSASSKILGNVYKIGFSLGNLLELSPNARCEFRTYGNFQINFLSTVKA